MATLADRILEVSTLERAEAEHLRALCRSWQVLADLSFSDLLLYVSGVEKDTFMISAQLRPFTSQTLYPHDMVGTTFTQFEQPIVERAFREGRIWAQDDPVLVDGIPIRMDAVPVRFDGKVVGVVTKEGSPATSRRPGRMEQIYLDAAEHVSRMMCDGSFPYPDPPPGDWPRVGDGLLTLDEAGHVMWASPNAVSALRRLGLSQNLLGRDLDEIGLGQTPVKEALASARLLDGELSHGDSHIRMRVLPLTEDGETVGGLALARDVSELRQRDRVISVKDATIREIHHRVKNNLQTIASLLRLQSRRLHSQEAKAALNESVMRIGSIALVHETLSENPQDVAEFGEVARRIAKMVSDGLVLPHQQIEVRVGGRVGPLDADLATPLAVTLAELLQNAIEHAFPDDRSGTVKVELSRETDDVVMVVGDDGVGISGNVLGGARLGLQIVRSLIDELGGSMTVAADDGTRVEVRVPASR